MISISIWTNCPALPRDLGSPPMAGFVRGLARLAFDSSTKLVAFGVVSFILFVSGLLLIVYVQKGVANRACCKLANDCGYSSSYPRAEDCRTDLRVYDCPLYCNPFRTW